MDYHKSSAKYEKYVRTELIREWDSTLPTIDVIMFRPSTAGAVEDDETIRRTVKILQYNGFGGCRVYNLADISEITFEGVVVCAWGKKIKPEKSKRILSSLGHAVFPFCFGLNMDGTPKLPTRLPHDTELLRM
jgi:hypothetical protein